jgi:hypothetical protein
MKGRTLIVFLAFICSAFIPKALRSCEQAYSTLPTVQR